MGYPSRGPMNKMHSINAEREQGCNPVLREAASCALLAPAVLFLGGAEVFSEPLLTES